MGGCGHSLWLTSQHPAGLRAAALGARWPPRLSGQLERPWQGAFRRTCVRGASSAPVPGVAFFKGDAVPAPDYGPALTSSTATVPGRVLMHFARQGFSILLQEKDPLCKARLNHSFHFLMGFG